MAALSTDHFAVPGTTETTVQVWQIHPKTGKINLLFFNNPQKANMGGQVPQNNLQFRIYESDDRDSWTLISGGSPITVTPGGSEDATVMTQKRYLRFTGQGVGGGGYARIDAQYRGNLYFGQIDIDMVGKSGYGFDGGAAAGIGEYGAAAWPES